MSFPGHHQSIFHWLPREPNNRDQTKVSLILANQILSKQSHDNNAVFSPLSLHVVLNIIANGNHGPAQQQLLYFLRSKSTHHLNSIASQILSDVLSDASPAGGPRLSVANAMLIDRSLTLHDSFKELVTTCYKATLNSVDFKNEAEEVRRQVNLWAENETSGLIKELLPPGSVNSSHDLIFANALYFKGAWNQKFDASKTKDYDFHLLNGTSVKVPFMTSKKMQDVRAFDGFKVLGLPYKQGEDKRQFSMYIFLPNAKDGLSALVERVASESGFLERTIRFPDISKVGDFRIPRFKISFGPEISKVLKQLGVDLQELRVSDIFHKSFIEVNEEGAEAAAATAAVMLYMSAGPMRVPPPIDFVADHPFLFLIRENLTGTVLFIGQVCNPLAE